MLKNGVKKGLAKTLNIYYNARPKFWLFSKASPGLSLLQQWNIQSVYSVVPMV
jgi:hypothetical protein